MRVPRVRGLERDRRRPRGQHDVERVGERDVAVVRPFVIAPAEVHAQLLGRNVGDRVVERLDVHLRLLAPLRKGEVGVLDVPSHAQVRAVDLEDEAGLRDRLVLLPHRIGDREQVRLLGGIVLVAEEERHDAGRRGREERVLDLDARQRRLQVVDVGLGRLRVAHADRRVARRRLPARAPGVAEHALREIGEAGEVLVDERVAGAAEAGEAILDVGRVARLAHLAVVNHVDTRRGLLATTSATALHRLRRESAASITGTPSSLRTHPSAGPPAAAGCPCGS